jgi:hypothetical protein
VFLDTEYIKHVKGDGVVNSSYLISSLRQQMMAASLQLEEKREDAEYVVEARVGALATDSHDVTYGIPASSMLSNAASLVPNAPPIPTVPEISLAKRQDEMGATKIAVFAYHRETRAPVWQSGIAQARSKSKNTWIFGAGPFQRGTVHQGTEFAGEDLKIPLIGDGAKGTRPDPLTLYNREVLFLQSPEEVEEVRHASFSQPVAKAKAPADGSAKRKPAPKPAKSQPPAAKPENPPKPEKKS